MPHDVFISYSSTDKTVADAVCATLEQHRIRCWMAPRDVMPGVDYGDALITAIKECNVFLLVFSSHANASPQVTRETERAAAKGKAILPFRIEEVLPSRTLEFCISSTHWLDALTPPLEAHLARLVPAVQNLLRLYCDSPIAQTKSVTTESAFSRAAKMPSQEPVPPRQNTASPLPKPGKPRVSSNVKEPEVVIKLDRRLDNAGKGKTLRIPYSPDHPVYDLLNEIYYFIYPAARQNTFGKAWILTDAQTGKRLKQLESPDKNDESLALDQRSLSEVGIQPGAVLLVKLL